MDVSYMIFTGEGKEKRRIEPEEMFGDDKAYVEFRVGDFVHRIWGYEILSPKNYSPQI